MLQGTVSTIWHFKRELETLLFNCKASFGECYCVNSNCIRTSVSGRAWPGMPEPLKSEIDKLVLFQILEQTLHPVSSASPPPHFNHAFIVSITPFSLDVVGK